MGLQALPEVDADAGVVQAPDIVRINMTSEVDMFELLPNYNSTPIEDREALSFYKATLSGNRAQLVGTLPSILMSSLAKYLGPSKKGMVLKTAKQLKKLLRKEHLDDTRVDKLLSVLALKIL
jgi:hypothetical protein